MNITQQVEWLMNQVKCIIAENGCGGNTNIIHNNTLGKQGGSIELDQFYHLDKTQYDNLLLVLEDFIIPPTYIQPTSSINLNNSTYEVGSSVSINFIQSFNIGDSGGKIDETIEKNHITQTTTPIYNETLIVPLGQTVYGGQVHYLQGACKLNNVGVEDCTGRIEEGYTVTPEKTITGALRRFSGSVTNFPINGNEVRALLLGSSVVNTSNNFTFNTGTTNRRFVIAIPNNKTLVSVQNTGTNEFLTFTLDGSITTVPDANGDSQDYKYYILENAVPFSTNYTLNVILS